VFASRRHAQALAAGLPHQDHVDINADESFHFHNNKLDEMPCKLDSIENSRREISNPTFRITPIIKYLKLSLVSTNTAYK